VCAIAPLAASVYDAPALVTLLPIMAMSMPLVSLCTVPTASFRAKLNFRFPALYGSAELVMVQSLTIALAYLGFGVYSFAIPGPIAAAVRTLVFWWVAKPRLGGMRRRQLRMMGSNSAAVFGSRILTIMVSQGDYFVLGLLAAKPVVGAYFFAFSLAIQPIRMVAGNLSTVLFPAFANIRNDTVRQTEAAMLASRITAYTVLPCCFLQAALAQPILRLFFGEKWDAAVPLIAILSIGLGFDAVSWIAGALLKARGDFHRAFIYSVVFFPIFFLAVGAGALLGSAIGVATAVSLFYLVLAPVYSYLVFRISGVSVRRLASIYLPPTILAGIAILAARFLATVLSLENVGTLLLTALCGGAVYLILLRLFAAEIFREISHRLRHLIRGR
jgi:PST family polysaccharide transporter